MAAIIMNTQPQHVSAMLFVFAGLIMNNATCCLAVLSHYKN